MPIVTGNPIGLLLVLTYTVSVPPATGISIQINTNAQMQEMTGGMRG